MTTTNRFNPQESPVCLSLVGLIVICSLAALKKKKMFAAFIMHPVSVRKHKEYYRFLTSDFIHNDLMHLFVNAFALFAIGSQLEEFLRSEKTLGSFLFLAIYVSSCFCGMLVTYLKYRNDFGYSSAGASGSVLGCMMAFMVLRPYHIAFYAPVYGGVTNMYTALIYILFLIGYQVRTANPLVNNEVHFYGALGGIIAALILK